MKIDVFQDTVCPWCRIGKQHLLQALAQWQGEPVHIQFRAFLLDPTTPTEGRPVSALAEKFGSQARLDEMNQRVCQVGEACGLNFQFERLQRLPNTLLSHQLIKITPDEQQLAMVDRLTEAHFEAGQDIGDIDVLADIAADLGMDAADTRQKLTEGVALPAVQADLEFASAAGISGVPFFIFDDKYALSGAQPIEVFLQAFSQVSEHA